MDRNIAALNFIARAAQDLNQMRGQVVAAMFWQEPNNLCQAGGPGSVRTPVPRPEARSGQSRSATPDRVKSETSRRPGRG